MRSTDSAVAGRVLLAGSVSISVAAGLVMSFPWQAILLVVAATVVSVVMITTMGSADERRDTRHWQEAVVAVSAWASRNAGRCETDPKAFPDNEEWTLPDSPRFQGTILAVGRKEGFEIGVACSEVSEGDGTARYTAFFVRLSREHSHVRLNPSRLRRTSLARAELVEIQGRELCIRYNGWPESLNLDVRVDAAIEVARALHIGEPLTPP